MKFPPPLRFCRTGEYQRWSHRKERPLKHRLRLTAIRLITCRRVSEMRKRGSTLLDYQRRGQRGEGSGYQNPSASPAHVSIPLFWDRHLSHVHVTLLLRNTIYRYHQSMRSKQIVLQESLWERDKTVWQIQGARVPRLMHKV